MKCEKCLHYEVCKSLEECNGIRMIKAEHCSFYRDETLMVDLPCKAGDVLFVKEYYVETENEYIEKVKCNEIEIVEDSISIICKTTEGSYDTYVPEDFGDCIFTTREEAEKAFEEQTDDV